MQATKCENTSGTIRVSTELEGKSSCYWQDDTDTRGGGRSVGRHGDLVLKGASTSEMCQRYKDCALELQKSVTDTNGL